MTEDDTFRKLKSLTEDEIELLQSETWIELALELNVGTVPIKLLQERMDKKLNPYGLTFMHDCLTPELRELHKDYLV